MNTSSAFKENMLNGQFVPQNITDERLVAAVSAVPREHFVPEHMQPTAYADAMIPVSSNRFLLAPVLQAQLFQLAEIDPHDAVLDIGCATGYSAAVLSHLAKSVTAVEQDDHLLQQAKTNVQKLQCSNVTFLHHSFADIAAISSQGHQYHVIIVEGALDKLPNEWGALLKEGGRLIALKLKEQKLGMKAGLATAYILRKQNGNLLASAVFDASAAPLPKLVQKKGFVFH